MIKKLLSLATVYMGVCLLLIIATGHLEQLNAALYAMTVRIVNNSGFVIGGTASATTGNYDHTVRVVDQTGTVLNPGTASATSANYDMTVRVVDASGFVQSSLGGAAAPAPSIQASSVPTPGVTFTSITKPAGSVNNDLQVGCFDFAGNPVYGTAFSTGFQQVNIGVAFTGQNVGCYAKQVNGDGASYTIGTVNAGGLVDLHCSDGSQAAVDLNGSVADTAHAAVTTVNALTSTSQVKNDLLLSWCFDTSSSASPSISFSGAGSPTSIFNNTGGYTTYAQALATVPLATAGATNGAITATATQSGNMACVNIPVLCSHN